MCDKKVLGIPVVVTSLCKGAPHVLVITNPQQRAIIDRLRSERESAVRAALEYRAWPDLSAPKP